MLDRLIGSNWKRLWIILVIALVPAGTAAQDLETKLAQRADFVPAAGSVREQLIQVAQHYKIPMGIEWVPSPEEKQVKLVLGEAPTVRVLLDAIFQASPDYSFIIRQGVVNVSDSRYAVDSRNFLNLRIGEFNLEKANVYGAEFELRHKIRATLQPERFAGGSNGGYGHGIPDESGLDVRNISFSGKDLKVRDILNRIVSANGNALWVVNLVPSRMKKSEPFFAQVDANEETDFSWNIISFNKSTQQ
jgi:hypothetical protein